jgi:hypothetical protein
MSKPSGPFFPIVQVDEIAFAMSLFVNAASLKIPKPLIQASSLPTTECGQVFRMLTGMMPPTSSSDLAEGESSLEYAFMALWTHYRGDVRQKSICARVLGFHRLMLLTRGALVADWVHSPEDRPEIILLHPAVVKAVAMTPLSECGAMVRPEFLRTLQIAADSTMKAAA